MQDYELELEPTDRMLLDALIRIKAQDDIAVAAPLLPRGRVRLGCDEHQRQQRARVHHPAVADLKEPVELRPLPGLPVIRDLIVDMTQFFKQYHSIKPYLVNNDPPPETERLQTPGGARASWMACTSASCAPAAPRRCPSFWWNPDKFVGPAGLLQAYRFIADTRDQATSERLDDLEDPYRLFRCHSIMNCVDVCPKGLNPTRAIGKIKELLVRRAV